MTGNAAGCGAHLKDYGHVLGGDPFWADRAKAFAARVRDVSEVVALINDHRRRVGEGRCRASGEPPVEQEQMVVGHQELRAPGGLFGLQGKALQLE